MFSRSLSRLSALASSSILSMPRSLSARCKRFTSTSIFRIRDHDKEDLRQDTVCTLRIEVRIHLMLLCHEGILFDRYQLSRFIGVSFFSKTKHNKRVLNRTGKRYRTRNEHRSCKTYFRYTISKSSCRNACLTTMSAIMFSPQHDQSLCK